MYVVDVISILFKQKSAALHFGKAALLDVILKTRFSLLGSLQLQLQRAHGPLYLLPLHRGPQAR